MGYCLLVIVTVVFGSWVSLVSVLDVKWGLDCLPVLSAELALPRCLLVKR